VKEMQQAWVTERRRCPSGLLPASSVDAQSTTTKSRRVLKLETKKALSGATGTRNEQATRPAVLSGSGPERNGITFRSIKKRKPD
jgi:hypothetical protein